MRGQVQKEKISSSGIQEHLAPWTTSNTSTCEVDMGRWSFRCAMGGKTEKSNYLFTYYDRKKKMGSKKKETKNLQKLFALILLLRILLR